ncbi:unnamed protein product, partial [Effrenium voratum]
YLLVFAGVLNLSWQRLQRAWWFLSLLLALVFVMGGTYAIAVEQEFPYVAVISLCHLIAGIAATLCLRHSGIHLVIGPESELDVYAAINNFAKEWKRISGRRFMEMLPLFLMSLVCRALCVHLEVYGEHPMQLILAGVVFLTLSSRLFALAYCHLHVVAGLELAVDNFVVDFFAEEDLKLAMQQWNVLQATLRSVSSKMSWHLTFLGSSCVISLLLLGKRVILRDVNWSSQDFLLELGWLQPPVMMFVYCLKRSADVTEKATRVAPLMNSWSAQENENWMDLERQYVVQHIQQSHAGFHVHGVRLSASVVNKLC